MISGSANPQFTSRSDLRLLVLADTTASFYTIQPNESDAKDKSSSEFWLKQDVSLPCYSQARIARFAPLSGRQAAIVT
jgi:hypothetical protein